tara:strand:+ start:268 stop:381 length:114 start_codon:yes stop_codon:yes gene_type:complete
MVLGPEWQPKPVDRLLIEEEQKEEQHLALKPGNGPYN